MPSQCLPSPYVPSILALLLSAFPVTDALAGPVIAPGWGAPVFREEFNGNAVDQSAWEVGNFANANNNEQQYYHPDQVSVNNGGLHLRADRDPNWTYGRNYNSGHVRTWQEWRYGRFEVRAKIPQGQGYWPAIWLLPRGSAWPVGGEIDIMENVGNDPYFVKGSYHYNWTPGTPITSNADYITGENFAANYHDYAVEWESDQIRFYVDGNLYHTVFNPVQPDPAPMSLILNLAVGGDWPGSPDGSTPFPSTFDIDYARVWQRPAYTPPPSSRLQDPGFEDNGGVLEDWFTFGNTIENVSSDYGTPLDGERSLKLYGQFNGEFNVSGAAQGVAISGGEEVMVSAQTLIRSEDSIVGTDNLVEMKLEFYSAFGASYDSEFFLGESMTIIADGSSPEDMWSAFEIQALAPIDAVEARLAFVFVQPESNPGGAVFVDSAELFAFRLGDANDDGLVNLLDLDILGTHWGTAGATRAEGDFNGDGVVTLLDLDILGANWGATSGSFDQALAASGLLVPEPSALIVLGLGGLAALPRVRTRRHG